MSQLGRQPTSFIKWRPADWRAVALGDVVDIATGQVDPKDSRYANMLHVGGDNIASHTGELFGLQTAADLGLISGKYLFEPQDILYSKIRPYLNKVAKPDFQGICSADIYPLRPKVGVATREFLALLLRTTDFLDYAATCSSRTSIPKINRDDLLRYPCSLPPLPEQKRIAAILDKAAAIRRKRQQAIELTENLLRSAFLEMFGDPVTNPKGWEVKPLSEISSITDGTHKTPRYLQSGVPFLSARNIRAHRIDWENTKFIAAEEHRELVCRCKPEQGDVLLTKSGTIGESAVVDRDCEFSLFESVALIKVDKRLMTPTILASALNHPSVRRLYGADVKGVGVKHLHLVDIRRLSVPLPPKDLQDRYAAFDARARELLSKDRIRCATANDLFGSLVHRAFLGDLSS